MQRVQVWSLVRELRSHIAAKKLGHKTQQYCKKFNKDFKNGPHQKSLLKIIIIKVRKLTSQGFPKNYVREHIKGTWRLPGIEHVILLPLTSYLSDEETEAQRGAVTCPQSHIKWAGDMAKTRTQISCQPEALALDILSSWVGGWCVRYNTQPIQTTLIEVKSRPASHLSNTTATSHRQLLSTWNMAFPKWDVL